MAITKCEICGDNDISHHSDGAYSCNNCGYGVPGAHGGGYADKIWYFCEREICGLLRSNDLRGIQHVHGMIAAYVEVQNEIYKITGVASE